MGLDCLRLDIGSIHIKECWYDWLYSDIDQPKSENWYDTGKPYSYDYVYHIISYHTMLALGFQKEELNNTSESSAKFLSWHPFSLAKFLWFTSLPTVTMIHREALIDDIMHSKIDLVLIWPHEGIINESSLTVQLGTIKVWLISNTYCNLLCILRNQRMVSYPSTVWHDDQPLRNMTNEMNTT